jgi:protoporphyrinogen oxidase
MSSRILIAGGGLTGLTLAYRLSRTPGREITVVERTDHFGGLAAGFPLCGTNLERTYHHLFLTDTAILALVDELGLHDRLCWCDSSTAIYLRGRVWPFMSAMDLLRFTPCSFPGRLRLGAVALYLQKRRAWRGLAPQTAYRWMSRACGESGMQSVWGPLLRGKFDRYAEKVSMAWLWARIHIRANSRKGGQREQLGYFKGGFAVIVDRLIAEAGRRGVRLRTGARIEELDPAHRRARVNGEWIEFDQFVFTGPSPAFGALLPDHAGLEAYRVKLESIEYLGAICLAFTSEQSIGDQYWLNINETGAPFLVFIHHTRLLDPSHYQGRHVYYIGAYLPPEHRFFGLNDDELAAHWWNYLRQIYPQFEPGRVQERHVFRFRHAQHIVDTDYESKLPAYATPLPGVWLANFSQIFPEDRGTNYAVREGNKLAAMIEAKLG